MRVAIYARFSDDVQNERSIEDQLKVCRRHAEARGWTVVAAFEDAALSGFAMANRPGIHALLAFAEARACDMVLVEDEDRLARNQEHIHHVKSRLDFAGVTLATLDSDEVDDLRLTFKGLIGAQYLKGLSQKTRRGMEGNFEKGLATGARLFGYRSRPGGAVEIVAEEADVIRRIFGLYIGGLTPREIANALNLERIAGPKGGLWNASTIGGNARRGNGVLRTELYAGVKVYGRLDKRTDPRTGKHIDRYRPPAEWRRLPVPHLAILEPGQWERAQARLTASATPQARSDRRKQGLFSGLLKCGRCGASYTSRGRNRLGCAGHLERGEAACDNRRLVPRTEIEARVLEGLRTRLLKPEAAEVYIAEYMAAWNEQRAAARTTRFRHEKRLAETERRIARIVGAIETGAFTPALAERLAALEAERVDLVAKVAEASAETPVVEYLPSAANAYRRTVAELEAQLKDAPRPPADQRLVDKVRPLIDRIVITPATGDKGGPYTVVLHGRLAHVLRGGEPSPRRSGGALVAGGGLEPPTCGL